MNADRQRSILIGYADVADYLHCQPNRSRITLPRNEHLAALRAVASLGMGQILKEIGLDRDFRRIGVSLLVTDTDDRFYHPRQHIRIQMVVVRTIALILLGIRAPILTESGSACLTPSRIAWVSLRRDDAVCKLLLAAKLQRFVQISNSKHSAVMVIIVARNDLLELLLQG